MYMSCKTYVKDVQVSVGFVWGLVWEGVGDGLDLSVHTYPRSDSRHPGLESTCNLSGRPETFQGYGSGEGSG